MGNRVILPQLVLWLAAAIPAPAAAQTDNPLTGAWMLEAVQLPDGRVLENPQPALVLFTGTHWSFVAVVPPNVKRPTYAGDQPTDAEKVRAYDSFIAGSGWYELKGDSILTRAYVHINSNAMSAWPERVMAYRVWVEGGKLYWSLGERGVGVYRNVEGTAPAGH
jgi:hypothetical protein